MHTLLKFAPIMPAFCSNYANILLCFCLPIFPIILLANRRIPNHGLAAYCYSESKITNLSNQLKVLLNKTMYSLAWPDPISLMGINIITCNIRTPRSLARLTWPEQHLVHAR